MNYERRLNAILDLDKPIIPGSNTPGFSTSGLTQSGLSWETLALVRAAATLANGLGIGPGTIRGIMEGYVDDDTIISEIYHHVDTVLLENDEKTGDFRGKRRGGNTPPPSRKIDKQDVSPDDSYRRWLDAGERDRAAARVDREYDYANNVDFMDTKTGVVDAIADEIANNIKKLPGNERAKATNDVINKLISAANKSARDSGYGDHTWKMRSRYEPTIPTPANAKDNFTPKPQDEVLNKILGKGSPRSECVTRLMHDALSDTIMVLLEHTLDDAIDNGIDAIVKLTNDWKVSPSTKTMVFRSVINRIIKGTGVNTRKHDLSKDVDRYVDKALAAQEHKPTKSIIINTRGMSDAQKATVKSAYEEALKRRGYSPRDASTKYTMELVVDLNYRMIGIVTDKNGDDHKVGHDKSGSFWVEVKPGKWQKVDNTTLLKAYKAGKFKKIDNTAQQNYYTPFEQGTTGYYVPASSYHPYGEVTTGASSSTRPSSARPRR